MDIEIKAGFLVVKTFERMCREYLANFEEWWQVKYPRADPMLPEQMPGKYRGIARDPIQPWISALRDSGVNEPTEQELAASLFMEELTKSGKAQDDFIFALDDAKELLEKIPPPVERQIIWAGRIDRADPPPSGTVVSGYEPTLFYPNDHSSVLGDNAFFVYRRPDNEDHEKKTDLRGCHTRLNKWGLFDTSAKAKQYLNFFLQLLSGQDSEVYYIAEIRAIGE